VESACQPRCSGGGDKTQAAAEGLSGSDHDECIECTDVEISQELLHLRQSFLIAGLQTQSFSLPAFTAVSGQYNFTKAPACPLSAGFSNQTSASFSEHLASTVIRC
jgi:hypothetical protein